MSYPSELWHELQAEAVQILATCTAASWRPHVAWAVGVKQLAHATYLTKLPLVPSTLGPERYGATLGRLGEFREYQSRRHLWKVTRSVYGKERRGPGAVLVGRDHWRYEHVIVSGRWAEVAELVTLDKVGAALHGEIVDACRTRRERTRTWDPTRPRDWHLTAEAERERRLWTEIERKCYHLAALAWARCKPVPKPMQLGLFEVAA